MTKGHKSLEVETRRNETKYEGLTFSKRLKNVEDSKLESLESCWRKAKSAANDTLPWLGESSHVGQDLPQKSLIHLILGDQRKFDAKASRSATLRSRCPSSWKAKWKKTRWKIWRNKKRSSCSATAMMRAWLCQVKKRVLKTLRDGCNVEGLKWPRARDLWLSRLSWLSTTLCVGHKHLKSQTWSSPLQRAWRVPCIVGDRAQLTKPGGI